MGLEYKIYGATAIRKWGVGAKVEEPETNMNVVHCHKIVAISYRLNFVLDPKWVQMDLLYIVHCRVLEFSREG